MNKTLDNNLINNNLTLLTNNNNNNDNNYFELYLNSFITVIYCIIFVTGILGNLSVYIVIYFNRYMHTVQNYYLFSLAVSDLLLVLTGLPNELHDLWFKHHLYAFSNVSCILYQFIIESASNATVLTITAFTIERYIAICHPFVCHTAPGKSRVIKYILATWILSFILATPLALTFGVYQTSKGYRWCNAVTEWLPIGYPFAISSLLFFFFPMIVISVMYSLIVFNLKSRSLRKLSQTSTINDRKLARRCETKVTRMLGVIVILFFICWAPYNAQRLMAVYWNDQTSIPGYIRKLHSHLTLISGVLYYLSATINPIVYSIMSRKFSRAFQNTMRKLGKFRVKHKIKNRKLGSSICTANQRSSRSFKLWKEAAPLQKN